MRQIADLAPGSTLAMTFLPPTELVDDADRAGLRMAEHYFANRTDRPRPSSGEDLLVATT